MRLLLLSLFLTVPLQAQTLHWQHTNGPYGGNFYCIAIGSSTIYGANGASTVYRSTDGGQSWIFAFYVNLPYGPSAYSAVANGTNSFLAIGAGVTWTTDNGVTWSEEDSTFKYADVLQLALTGNTLYAATDEDGILRSTDTCRTWVAINSGLPNHWIHSMVASGQNVIASTWYGNTGLFRSIDSGDTWEELDTTFRIKLVDQLVFIGNVLLASVDGQGVYRSTDTGTTWVLADTEILIRSISTFAVSGGILIAGTYGNGVLKSTDSGQSWSLIDSGLSGWGINCVAISGDTMFCSSNNTIDRSINNGSLWMPDNYGFGYSNALAMGTNGRLIFTSTGAGEYRTSDSGNSWSPVQIGLGNIFAYAFSIDGNSMFIATSSGVYKSTDSGDTWTPSSNGMTYREMSSLVSSDSVLLAGTYRGLFRSTDYGNSWTSANLGVDSIAVYSLAASDEKMVACTYSGIYCSTDYGGSWTLSQASGPTYSVAINGNTIIAGGYAISTDFGGTWKSIGGEEAMSLCINGSTIYAGQSGGGVLVSTDNGNTWIAEDSGMIDPNNQTSPIVRGLVILGSTLFAATDDGIFRADVSAFSSVSDASCTEAELPLTVNPNPGRSELLINYFTSTLKPEISLFNILGEQVMSIGGDGSGHTRLNVASLLPGIYEIVLRDGEQTAMQTVVIER